MSQYAPGGRTQSHQPPARRNEFKKHEKWSPELLAATATIIIAILAQGQTSLRFLPSGPDIGIAAAITVVTAAVLDRWLHRFTPAGRFLITLTCTLLVVLGFGFGAYWYRTAPGRDAQSAATNWRALRIPTEPQGKHISAGVSQYGTGYGYQDGNQVYIHIDSSESNLISWFPTASTTATYYAQVTARQLSGSDSTACVLSFAWKNKNSFFQMALRTDGLQLAYWDGKMPARAYEGPISVPYATNLNDWHTIAVLVENSRVTAFADNTKVFSEHISRSLTGGVTFGTLDIGSGYTDDATCEFSNAEVRTQR